MDGNFDVRNIISIEFEEGEYTANEGQSSSDELEVMLEASRKELAFEEEQARQEIPLSLIREFINGARETQMPVSDFCETVVEPLVSQQCGIY